MLARMERAVLTEARCNPLRWAENSLHNEGSQRFAERRTPLGQ